MKTATASELDRMFDEGEDMTEYMDLSDVRRVSLDMAEEDEREARRAAVSA